MSQGYIDFDLIDKYPNKYNLTPKSIKKLKILDWGKLKSKTWFNHAMLSGTWWCHLEGCNDKGPYNSEVEFWIGFNEDNNQINCSFTSFDGMCKYNFTKFYSSKSITNKFYMQMQVNTIRWLNMMIDEGILGL